MDSSSEMSAKADAETTRSVDFYESLVFSRSIQTKSNFLNIL